MSLEEKLPSGETEKGRLLSDSLWYKLNIPGKILSFGEKEKTNSLPDSSWPSPLLIKQMTVEECPLMKDTIGHYLISFGHN